MDTFLKDITRAAGKETLKYFGETGVAYTKAHVSDVVTKADLAAEKVILEAVKSQYPEHGIVSEEAGAEALDADYTWFIDPIDGTANFATNIPLFGTMIAVAHKGELIMSAVHLPVSDELFFARKDGGAFVNDKKIQSSQKTVLKESYGLQSGSMRNQAKATASRKLARHLAGSPTFLLALASSAVSGAYVASGRRDWLVTMGGGGVWDYAAIYLLMREAGCETTTLSGEPWTLDMIDQGMIAGSPALNEQLVAIMKEA